MGSERDEGDREDRRFLAQGVRCAPEGGHGMGRSLAGRSDKSRFSECEVPVGPTRGVVRVKVWAGAGDTDWA